jgi:hypothetical protein
MTWQPFEYVVLRVVPRVDRGESINAGVVVYCQALDYLGCRVHLDRQRLAALDASADADHIDRALAAVSDGCRSAAELGPWFRWLTAPRSTVVQPGPVHTGLTADPAAELDRLLQRLVLP